MAEDDWDLQAVVRGCTTNSAVSCSCSITTTTATATATAANNSFSTGVINSCILPQQQQDDYFLRMEDLYTRNGGDSVDLFDLYKPFYRKSSPPLSPQSIIPISPLSAIGLQDLSQQIHHQNHQMLKQKHNLSVGGGGQSRSTKGSNASSSHTQKYSRGKKRKNQMKKVIEIPADALSSDMWSWRKYGQKPIKGSPYPRGYYRCSTSKGCLARKQVERSRSDPGMFIVTYTSEHNHPMPTHRNSLAGSSRQKPASSGEPSSKQSGCSRSSPPVSPLSVSLSPEEEKFEIESCKDEIIEDGDENISMNLEDDFFDGLEEIAAINYAGISNGVSQTIQFPWLTNNATTTAAGGI